VRGAASVFKEKMKRLASIFLRAKDWQLFALLCVLPPVVETAAAVSIPIRTIQSWDDLRAADFLLLGGMELYLPFSSFDAKPDWALVRTS
jgi:hypothetical protein